MRHQRRHPARSRPQADATAARSTRLTPPDPPARSGHHGCPGYSARNPAAAAATPPQASPLAARLPRRPHPSGLRVRLETKHLIHAPTRRPRAAISGPPRVSRPNGSTRAPRTLAAQASAAADATASAPAIAASRSIADWPASPPARAASRRVQWVPRGPALRRRVVPVAQLPAAPASGFGLRWRARARRQGSTRRCSAHIGHASGRQPAGSPALHSRRSRMDRRCAWVANVAGRFVTRQWRAANQHALRFRRAARRWQEWTAKRAFAWCDSTGWGCDTAERQPGLAQRGRAGSAARSQLQLARRRVPLAARPFRRRQDQPAAPDVPRECGQPAAACPSSAPTSRPRNAARCRGCAAVSAWCSRISGCCRTCRPSTMSRCRCGSPAGPRARSAPTSAKCCAGSASPSRPTPARPNCPAASSSASPSPAR